MLKPSSNNKPCPISAFLSSSAKLNDSRIQNFVIAQNVFDSLEEYSTVVEIEIMMHGVQSTVFHSSIQRDVEILLLGLVCRNLHDLREEEVYLRE
jgi:hypothetical protein